MLLSLSFGFLHRNLQGKEYPNAHPIPKISSILECRDHCRNRSQCSGCVWNCDNDCYLKRGPLHALEEYEHCTFSWLRNKRQRTYVMQDEACDEEKTFKKFSVVVTYFKGIRIDIASFLRQTLAHGHTVFIYHHCDVSCTRTPDIRFCIFAPTCMVTRLPNIGREAHVAFFHIREHYHTLHDMTFFIQDNEWGGMKPFLHEALVQKRPRAHYFIGGLSHPCEGGASLGRNFCWKAQDLQPDMVRVFNYLQKPPPVAPFPCALRGAFAVHRRAVHTNTLQIYRTMFESASDRNHSRKVLGCAHYKNSSPVAGTLIAHTYERLWPTVFHTDRAVCVKCDQDSPVYEGDPHSDMNLPPLIYNFRKTYQNVILSKRIIHEFRDAVNASVHRSSSMVPKGCVTISVASRHHLKLRTLAFSRLRGETEFLNRFVSICLGFTDQLGTCVHHEDMNLQGDFNSLIYHRLVWVKWHMLFLCSDISRFTLFLDSDTFVLRNPWNAFDLEGAHAPYDALFQAEGACESCSHCPMSNDAIFRDVDSWVCGEYPSQCPANGGQILLNNRNPALVSRMMRVRPCKINHATALDQHILDNIRDNQNLRVCALPWTMGGHCWISKRFEDWCQLRTYHLQCLPTRFEKERQLYLVKNATRSCRDLLF